jgi:hypothetical protein
MPWSLTSFVSRVEGGEAVLDIRGSYAGTLAAYEVRIDGRGLVTVGYDIQGRPEGASELGIAFLLPKDVESLRWKRAGLHSVYPDGHIGRNEGSAVKVRPGSTDVYRTPPAWPWAADMTDYFLYGKDHPGYGGTRDFRSLKANILWTETAFPAGGSRLRVESDGSQAVRAEVLPDGAVRFNIIGAWAYPDLGWGNDGGMKKLPGILKGTVRLRIAAASGTMP